MTDYTYIAIAVFKIITWIQRQFICWTGPIFMCLELPEKQTYILEANWSALDPDQNPSNYKKKSTKMKQTHRRLPTGPYRKQDSQDE